MMGGKVKETTTQMDYFIKKIQTEKDRIGRVKQEINMLENYLERIESDINAINSQTTIAKENIEAIKNKIR